MVHFPMEQKKVVQGGFTFLRRKFILETGVRGRVPRMPYHKQASKMNEICSIYNSVTLHPVPVTKLPIELCASHQIILPAELYL